MFSPFRLKQPIGEAFNMDLDDSLNTKKALAHIGHMKLPDHGLTEFPDLPMIEGVKSFQREQGLREDGVMKPDGPTIQRLNATLERKQGPSLNSVFARPPTNTAQEPKIADTIATPEATASAERRTLQFNPNRAPSANVTSFGRGEVQANKATSADLFQPINLKRSVTPVSNIDLGDAGRIKKALDDLGLLDRRNHGLDEFPDVPMFEGIKQFQRQEGLREDGEMKPEGETVQRLNQVMAERTTDQAGDRTGGNDIDGPQVAMAPAAVVAAPLLGAAARAVLSQAGRSAAGGAAVGAAGALTRDTPQQDRGTEKPPQAQRISPAPKISPPPGIEPPDEKLPDRTESLPQPVELLDLSQPLPKHNKPTIFVLPVPKAGEFGDGIVEMKGNEATRKELECIRDYFEQVKGWKHEAGGRYSPLHKDVRNGKKKAGDEQTERHIKGHFKGRKGGHFTDLTFTDDRGRTVHIQSVDVDRNGKPTQRELDNAEKIRKATENEDILLIPKGAQLNCNQGFQKRQ